MADNVFRRLAHRLDTIPNGFPQTESGVELKLLERLYTPEEAALAAEMQLSSESAGEIARRAGLDPTVVRAILEDMAKKGLIRASREGGKRRYGLMPFVVGIYEAQLSRLDEEMAGLFEAYYLEAFAKEVLSKSPPLHVVIPVERSIPFELQVFPYEQASVLLENAKSFGVRRCICRVQKALIGESCEFPVESCLVFTGVEGVFDDDPDIRVLTKEEALQVLRESEEAGLIHSSANIREGRSYICNCCTCCCGIMRGLSQFGLGNAIAKSDFHTEVDARVCTGCGVCLERCQFGAPSLLDGVSCVDERRCVGCGLCVVICTSGAMKLVRKSEDRISPPRDRSEWLRERAKNRGISLEEIL